ncbi:hypothetical protein [Streptomyces sp. SAJ15]|uniref:hypothetical protein n=1 Tax=Streptomyces sp. SAJ15 TaxID=2011095 RepID=UPI001643267C|nr:hypothetical protein [Streptomyces sp. SAJ15]
MSSVDDDTAGSAGEPGGPAADGAQSEGRGADGGRGEDRQADGRRQDGEGRDRDGRQREAKPDGEEREREQPRRLGAPKGSPLGGAGADGGARTAREARANFHVEGDNQIYEGNTFFHTQVLPGPEEVFVDGPVPRERLDHVRRVYCPVPGYERMRRRLELTHLLALCGEHGTGRGSTSLALLAQVTGGEVSRLDPYTALGRVDTSRFEEGRGYLLELPDGDTYDGGYGGEPPEERGHRDRDRGSGAAPGPRRLTELHLDRLSAALAERGAYGVILVGAGDLADVLVRGRYGLVCAPPPADEVLNRHLTSLLAEAPGQTLLLARANAARADVREALGLDELRPGEAARLAGHLAAHATGGLSDAELLRECRWFAPRQAQEWFAGADRPGTLPGALPALRGAALRIALAVFNGSADSLAAEAGELLSWELAVTLDPQYAPGRSLFTAHTGARLAAARAVPGRGEEDLGEATIPVRVVRFQGQRLATAVLYEAWDGYHNVRGPMSRWLRTLCDDPRPQVWVRAAIAAGVLCSWDYLYGFSELLLPLARADSPVQRMAAATALAEAARDEAVRPAVRGLLRDWARGDDEEARETAALAHGYGLAAGSVSASLDQLGRIGCRDGGESAEIASYSVVRLLAGPEPEDVLQRLASWYRDRRQDRQNLALLTVLRAVTTRTSHLWGLRDTPELEPYASWPLVAALVEARPEHTRWLSDLVWCALTTARSGAAALEAMAGWMRRAARDERQLTSLCDFLPRLVSQERDRERLLLLIARLAGDIDEPLNARAAERMRQALLPDGPESGPDLAVAYRPGSAPRHGPARDSGPRGPVRGPAPDPAETPHEGWHEREGHR